MLKFRLFLIIQSKCVKYRFESSDCVDKLHVISNSWNIFSHSMGDKNKTLSKIVCQIEKLKKNLKMFHILTLKLYKAAESINGEVWDIISF